jgi:hypothetical protein
LFCPVFRHLFFTQKKFTRSENDDQMASVKWEQVFGLMLIKNSQYTY